MQHNIKARFAPSPTGYLHIGGARTALFNWLYTRKHDGKFILRIEDTDVKRSSDEMVTAITDNMKWLGLSWDEGPFFQSDRLEQYQKFAQKLVEDGKAYYCYCTPERLKKLKASQKKSGEKDWIYDRHCLHLSEAEKAELDAKNVPKVIRCLVPDGNTVFQDEVQGELVFDNSTIEDFVLLRSDGIPTYHLAVVVDDSEMEITNIIRGADHISNTPKQIMLYEAAGLPVPKFAHVPLILGTDKKRLSKRHGATAVGEFQKKGILPEALFNYLALLGWSPGDDREIMPKEELIASFSLDGISTSNAVFDEQKLEWMNGQYINNADSERLRCLLVENGFVSESIAENQSEYLLKIIDLQKSRMKTLAEFTELSAYFFEDVNEYDAKAVKKYWRKDWSLNVMERLIELLESIEEFTEENLETQMRALAKTLDVGAGKVIHPTRLAITGRKVSPGIFETMVVLGKETVIHRMKNGLEYLKSV